MARFSWKVLHRKYVGHQYVLVCDYYSDCMVTVEHSNYMLSNNFYQGEWNKTNVYSVLKNVNKFQLNKYEKIVSNKLHNRQMNYKKKAAIMMFMVTITFMICRIPFTVIIVYRDQLIKNRRIGVYQNVSIFVVVKFYL